MHWHCLHGHCLHGCLHGHCLHGQYIQMKGVRYILLVYFYATSCTIILQMCGHFNVSAKGHARKHTVGRGHQPGLTPNKLTAHLLEIATPPVFSHESYPPLASQNNVTVLNELKCVAIVCSNILLWPLELPCRKLVCTRCVMEQVAASTTVCSCYSKDGSLVPREIGPIKCHINVAEGYTGTVYGMPQRCEGWLL